MALGHFNIHFIFTGRNIAGDGRDGWRHIEFPFIPRVADTVVIPGDMLDVGGKYELDSGKEPTATVVKVKYPIDDSIGGEAFDQRIVKVFCVQD